MTAHVPRINRRVLTVFLLVGLPILAASIGLVLAVGQSQLRANYGQHLGQVAQQTAAAVDAYVYRRILDVALLGRTPELRSAASAASARPLLPQEVERESVAWQKGSPLPPPLAAVLSSPASRYLADIVAHDQIYRELILTDRHGRLIAASNRPATYFLGEEDWWKAALDDGTRGRVTVSDVRWDSEGGRYAIDIAVPVPETGSDRLAGILKVTGDGRELLAMVGSAQLGATGEAMLLRDNGSIVFSRRLRDPNARFFATEAFRQRADVLRQGGPEHAATFDALGNDDVNWLVGVAGSQLGRSYPTLSWFVVVMQSEDELLAPVRALAWYLLAAFALTAVAVLVFALWLSMRIAHSPVEADMHLVEHPPVMHVGETEEPILHQ